ncbi:uncharacterized protein [Drosophila bipectinata]|uniref:uncharacterized protein n=1 Tax=Drosophila bipectinata TaxID=42026 RepID=UPI0038B31912
MDHNHQRVKGIFTDMDSILQNGTGPFSDERERIDADLKSLDNLITQKVDEYHELLRLRSFKEDVREGLERQKLVSAIKDMLPPLLLKSCSTMDLQEIHSTLLKEKAPIPSKNGPTGSETVKIVKGFLGIKPQDPPMSLRKFKEENVFGPILKMEQSSEMPPVKKRAKLERLPAELTSSMPNLERLSYLYDIIDEGTAPMNGEEEEYCIYGCTPKWD